MFAFFPKQQYFCVMLSATAGNVHLSVFIKCPPHLGRICRDCILEYYIVLLVINVKLHFVQSESLQVYISALQKAPDGCTQKEPLRTPL